MKRKIVQHGNSSLTITLPFSWVRQHHIQKGDELEMEQQGNTLKITAAGDSRQEKKTVTFTEFGFFTKNNLSHLYQNGYDEIEIQYKDAAELEGIKSTIQECLGFEIIDQRKNTIYIKSIAQNLESEFDTLLRKAFLITKEMGEELASALEAKDLARLPQIRSLESMNNKLTLCCLRILAKRGYQKPERVPQMWSVIKELERIADNYKYICDMLSSEAPHVSDKAIAFLKEVNSYFTAFYQLFYKFSPELKKTIYLDKKRLEKSGKALLEKSKGSEGLLIHYTLAIITHTHDGAASYFAVIL